MEVPQVVPSEYGPKTIKVFRPPFVRADFMEMERLLGDLTVAGFTPIRWLERVDDADQFRIVITTCGAAA